VGKGFADAATIQTTDVAFLAAFRAAMWPEGRGGRNWGNPCSFKRYADNLRTGSVLSSGRAVKAVASKKPEFDFAAIAVC